MTDRDLWQLSMREIADAVRSRSTTARAVIDAHLERIDAVNPAVNALTVVFHERARALADAVDAALDAGEDVGPLAGVPFTVKENIDLTWSASTSGWPFMAEAVPAKDATMVRRLLEAGAIPIGRGNMPDWGLRWDTDNDLFGRTLNPWDAFRVPGGSSGGDAVAVATGMTPLGLGNDYGGSLRLPAYAAGVCALRPSAGRIPAPMADITEPVSLSLQFFAVNGPIARTVDDLDTAFTVMHGADGSDPAALTLPHPAAYDGPRRVAVVRDPLGWGVDPQVAAAVDRAAAALAAAGWTVDDVEPPLIEEAATLWRRISTTEMVGAFLPGALPMPLSHGSTRYFLDNAEQTEVLASGEAYGGAWARRAVIAAAWERFQAEYPIVLGPVSARRMPEIGYDLSGPAATTELWRDHRLLVTVNFLGLPSVAVPTGLDEDGLPTGVQLIGPRNADHVSLAAGRDVEAALGGLTPVEARIAGAVA
ncbi:amidase family protein [Microbacterium yannicii]|uniref:Amidase family protein n=1 Tax=Microbacterium yannicii TaxID=671622 RepID=A0ABP9M274_9MICO|nr:amidase [Microbacterium yannicii]MCO5954502.1 amidase [Microbacterium yannicii]